MVDKYIYATNKEGIPKACGFLNPEYILDYLEREQPENVKCAMVFLMKEYRGTVNPVQVERICTEWFDN